MRLLSIILLLTVLSCGVVAQNPPPPVKEYNPNAWKEFTSAEGKFSVSLPGRPAHQDSTLDTPIGKITTHAFLLETDLGYYYVSYADFPSVGPLTPEDNKEMLDSSRDQALASGAKLISESDVSLGEIKGRELLVVKDELILRSRYFVVKGRLYQLILGVKPMVAFRNAKPSADPKNRTDIFESTSVRFFDSFKLTQ